MQQLIEKLHAVNTQQGREPLSLPHGRNLLTQLEQKKFDVNYLEKIVSAYITLRDAYADTKSEPSEFISHLIDSLNEYLEALAKDNKFKHQSDFVSSVIPEAICTVFHNAILRKQFQKQSHLLVSTQKDLAIECSFSPSNGGSIHYKNKQVDVAVVKECCLSFNGCDSTFLLPLITVEVKTNLDKNMISGVETSVLDLKKTFPMCKCYVVSEFSDFGYSKQNYAGTDIDEIYILRKQKRSDVRDAKHKKYKIGVECFIELYESLVASIEDMEKAPLPLSERLKSGKLINY